MMGLSAFDKQTDNQSLAISFAQLGSLNMKMVINLLDQIRWLRR